MAAVAGLDAGAGAAYTLRCHTSANDSEITNLKFKHHTMASPSTLDQVFTIPTVDISSYLDDPDSSAAREIIEQIRNACTTSGFFQITGHRIPTTLQAAVLQAAKELFDLPLEEKIKLTGPKSRGYELIGSQVLQQGAKPDLKEVSANPRDSIHRAHRSPELLHRSR